MFVLPAHLVAAPVLERLGGERAGVVLGAGATAAWVDLDGFVVAVTTREVPLLPDAVAVAAGSGALARPGVAPGAPARLAPGRVDLGPLRVTWDPATPPAWDPAVPVPPDANQDSVARRGAALLDALGVGAPGAVDNPVPPSGGSATLPEGAPIAAGRGRARPAAASSWVGLPTARGTREPGTALPAAPGTRQPGTELPGALVGELARIGLPTAVDPDGAAGLGLLFRGVGERDPEPAAAGARELLGRGPGLTPEGDDLLAAVAGTLAVLGPVTGWGRSVLSSMLAALVAPAPARTTALSATLLQLAARGLLAEPAGRLLDLGQGGEAAWPAALARLRRLGHGSGRAYATGIAAASLLAAGPGRRAAP